MGHVIFIRQYPVDFPKQKKTQRILEHLGYSTHKQYYNFVFSDHNILCQNELFDPQTYNYMYFTRFSR